MENAQALYFLLGQRLEASSRLEPHSVTSCLLSRPQGKYCRMEKYGRTGQTLDSMQMARVRLFTVRHRRQLRDVRGLPVLGLSRESSQEEAVSHSMQAGYVIGHEYIILLFSTFVLSPLLGMR